MKYEYTQHNYSPTDEEILDDLKRVVTTHNLSRLTIKEYEAYGRYNSSTVYRRFGTWNNALNKAQIPVAQQYWTDSQLFENLESAWQKKGNQPSRRDMNNQSFSCISSKAYERRFGKWSNALKEFIDFVNGDDIESNNMQTANSSSVNIPCRHTTKRDISLRLRFKVLSRDGFKCCSCGASPAKDSSVELQVDHIVPWSKGGETVIENLQTLCSKCNLGKSDTVENNDC